MTFRLTVFMKFLYACEKDCALPDEDIMRCKMVRLRDKKMCGLHYLNKNFVDNCSHVDDNVDDVEQCISDNIFKNSRYNAKAQQKQPHSTTIVGLVGCAFYLLHLVKYYLYFITEIFIFACLT